MASLRSTPPSTACGCCEKRRSAGCFFAPVSPLQPASSWNQSTGGEHAGPREEKAERWSLRQKEGGPGWIKEETKGGGGQLLSSTSLLLSPRFDSRRRLFVDRRLAHVRPQDKRLCLDLSAPRVLHRSPPHHNHLVWDQAVQSREGWASRRAYFFSAA